MNLKDTEKINENMEFTIEELPLAFESLVAWERQETVERLKELMDQREDAKISVQNKFMPKASYMGGQMQRDPDGLTFRDADYSDANVEIGYFAELDVDFKSSGEDIKRKYLQKMKKYLLDKDKLSLKKDRYILKELHRIVNAYKVLEKEEDRIEYLNVLRIRSFASQYLSVAPQFKDGHFFPFFIFVVRKGEE